MRLLFVTSEIFPLIKTGGLADVSGALPMALSQSGIDVQIILPAYRGITKQCDAIDYLGKLSVFSGLNCDIYKTTLPGTAIPLLLIDCPELYDREGGPYHHPQNGDWQDNPLRFGVLSKAAAILARPNTLQNWYADIVHCNDWQSGLTPYYLKQSDHKIKSLFSIHNMAFQGNFHPDWRYKLELSDHDFQPEGYEYFGHLSFMKAGLYYATQLTTVSPTYAREIQTKEFGFGFEGLLRYRSAQLTGILNGIDTEVWNPETDPYLCAHYNFKRLSQKKKIKHALQQELGLHCNTNLPLLGIVSRLTFQKGLDMVLAVADELLQSTSCQLAILGSGELDLENQYERLMTRYSGRVSTTIGYNESLSHRIMAGTDIFVMPSRFEPCGLNQLYGLRYGTIPLVANTGGLADSVIGVNQSSSGEIDQNATGFVMSENNAETLLVTLRKAIDTYANSGHWKQLQKHAMQQDVSWKTSAKHYIDIYNQLIIS